MWLWDGFANALRMAWEVWWALVLGFALSGIVQAWVPRKQLQSALGGRGARAERESDAGCGSEHGRTAGEVHERSPWR